MDANKLLSQDKLLTGECNGQEGLAPIDRPSGYVPGAEALSVIAGWVKRMEAKNPMLVYLLDRELDSTSPLCHAK